MPLSTAEHQIVQAATKQTRNRNGRAWRGTLAGRLTTVTLLDVTLPTGEVALTDPDTGRGCVLRRDQSGAWRCPCFTAAYSVPRTCAHQEAANAGRAELVQKGA